MIPLGAVGKIRKSLGTVTKVLKCSSERDNKRQGQNKVCTGNLTNDMHTIIGSITNDMNTTTGKASPRNSVCLRKNPHMAQKRLTPENLGVRK